MKTKYRIMQAMEELTREYSYEEITIQMITQKVPIARQGFYKFFQNKEDLCRQTYLYYTEQTITMEKDFSLYEFIFHDLTEINQHISFFSKLANQPYMFSDNRLYSILYSKVFRIYMRMLRHQLKAEPDDDTAFMLNAYCIGGLYQLVEILKSGKPMDVKHLTDLYIEMIPQPVKELLIHGQYPAEIIKD